MVIELISELVIVTTAVVIITSWVEVIELNRTKPTASQLYNMHLLHQPKMTTDVINVAMYDYTELHGLALLPSVNCL